MENIIIVGILVLIVGAAIYYIRKSKKKGVKCIGCPHAGTCGSKNNFNRQCGNCAGEN